MVRAARLSSFAGLLAVSAVFAGCSSDSADEEAFCETARDLEALAEEEASFNALTDESGTAAGNLSQFRADLREQTEEAERLMKRLDATAPAEIDDDVEVVVDIGLKLSERLQAADYNPAVLFAAGDLMAEAGEDRVNESADRVGEHLRDGCGIETDRFTGFGVPTDPEAPPPPTPPPAPGAPSG